MLLSWYFQKHLYNHRSQREPCPLPYSLRRTGWLQDPWIAAHCNRYLHACSIFKSESDISAGTLHDRKTGADAGASACQSSSCLHGDSARIRSLPGIADHRRRKNKGSALFLEDFQNKESTPHISFRSNDPLHWKRSPSDTSRRNLSDTASGSRNRHLLCLYR